MLRRFQQLAREWRSELEQLEAQFFLLARLRRSTSEDPRPNEVLPRPANGARLGRERAAAQREGRRVPHRSRPRAPAADRSDRRPGGGLERKAPSARICAHGGSVALLLGT